MLPTGYPTESFYIFSQFGSADWSAIRAKSFIKLHNFFSRRLHFFLIVMKSISQRLLDNVENKLLDSLNPDLFTALYPILCIKNFLKNPFNFYLLIIIIFGDSVKNERTRATKLEEGGGPNAPS